MTLTLAPGATNIVPLQTVLRQDLLLPFNTLCPASGSPHHPILHTRNRRLKDRICCDISKEKMMPKKR